MKWITLNRLKVNGDQTESTVFVSPLLCNTLPSLPPLIGLIKGVCKAPYLHLHKLYLIRPCLDLSSTESLVHAFITSRLDYGNSLLSALPDCHINNLQRVLNTAARIVSLKPKFEHITPVIRDLHWLPIIQCIKFKVLLLSYQAYNGSTPPYLCEIIAHYEPKYSLRSASKSTAVVLPTNMSYGDHAFQNYGPKMWNSLDPKLRKISNLIAFKCAIKTMLFKQAYGV